MHAGEAEIKPHQFTNHISMEVNFRVQILLFFWAKRIVLMLIPVAGLVVVRRNICLFWKSKSIRTAPKTADLLILIGICWQNDELSDLPVHLHMNCTRE
jgi:hypothetical protein